MNSSCGAMPVAQIMQTGLYRCPYCHPTCKRPEHIISELIAKGKRLASLLAMLYQISVFSAVYDSDTDTDAAPLQSPASAPYFENLNYPAPPASCYHLREGGKKEMKSQPAHRISAFLLRGTRQKQPLNR